MKKYFANIGTEPNAKISRVEKIPIKRKGNQSLFLTENKNNEVENAIKQTEIYDGIISKIFKTFYPVMSEPLTQKRVKTRIHPTKLKVAEVTPFHKDSKVPDNENYRPISL